MRIHWGTGLGVVFGMFAVGILILVRISMNHDIDLVSDDYYQRELHHQDQIDTQKRSNELAEQPRIVVTPSTVAVTIPRIFTAEHTIGELSFYRPANRHEDFVVMMKLDTSNTQFVPIASLQKGLWRIKVRWAEESKEYYYEEAVMIQ